MIQHAGRLITTPTTKCNQQQSFKYERSEKCGAEADMVLWFLSESQGTRKDTSCPDTLQVPGLGTISISQAINVSLMKTNVSSERFSWQVWCHRWCGQAEPDLYIATFDFYLFTSSWELCLWFVLLFVCLVVYYILRQGSLDRQVIIKTCIHCRFGLSVQQIWEKSSRE